jgi:hypothetical protein
VFPRHCENGHLIASEADVMRHQDKWQRCRHCHTVTVRLQRQRALLANKRPQAEPVARPSPKGRTPLGPITSIPADADIVRVWAEGNGLQFQSWRDLQAINAARRQAGRLEFEARP